MSNLFSGFRSRGSSKGGGNTGRPKTSASASPPLPQPENPPNSGAWSSPSILPPLPHSESLSSSVGIIMSSTADDFLGSYHLPHPLPAWVNPAYAKHIVKGNFMTLIARPKTVEHGEWIAHQVVEHYRNLWHFVRVIYEKEDTGLSICNPSKCPKMSAGPNHSYTWLNRNMEPVELPAFEYITLMQRWTSGKIDDTKIFPTDQTGVSWALNPAFTSAPAAGSNSGDDWLGRRSGFPREFGSICQTIFLQMFRVYAHLYHAHFVEPFYHLNLEKQLNSCFSHFILTATTLDLLKPHELEPMQPLIDLWAANGTFPVESKAYQMANLRAGQTLLAMAGQS